MQLFEDNQSNSILYQRFVSSMISKELANQISGKTPPPRKESEQEYRRRELLDVEEKTNKSKVAAQNKQKNIINHVKNQFFQKVHQHVELQLNDSENLFKHVLLIESYTPSILDMLSLKAASIKRISPLINALPWLSNELISIINQPKYRKNSDVKVTKINIALSYIGLDNLKLIIPTLMVKRWLPSQNEQFPMLRRKLWSDSLSVGLAAKVLANHNQENEFLAFSAGIFANAGMIAISKNFINTYNELHSNELISAFKTKNKHLHSALLDIGIPDELLFNFFIKNASTISYNIIKTMSLERLYIANIFKELATQKELTTMSSLAKTIIKARIFVMVRQLIKDKLITTDETKNLFMSAQLSAEEIKLLRKSDIDHIKLNFQ